MTSKIRQIKEWLIDYAAVCHKQTFVVGISGGIDSSVVSTLCAETGVHTHALILPIHQKPELNKLSVDHGNWLKCNYENVSISTIELTSAFDSLVDCFSFQENSSLSLANTRSRLRMISLYQVAANCNGLVVGTGNKVEDFGVGFFTKYGDGGVDISPIADLMKTEVWDIARELKVLQEIIDAPPTDGLWDDGRTDEQQLGISYKDLEWAMKNVDKDSKGFTTEQKKAISIYTEHHTKNLHKMNPIPVCKINND